VSVQVLHAQDEAVFYTLEAEFTAGVEAYNQEDYPTALTRLTSALRQMEETGQKPTNLDRAYLMLITANAKTTNWPGLAEAAKQYLARFPSAPDRDDVAFFLGIGLMQDGQNEAASEAFKEFIRVFPTSGNAQQATIFLAVTLLRAGQTIEGAKVLDEHKDELTGDKRAQAFKMLLASLIESEQLDEAADLVRKYEPAMPDNLSLAGFELAALQLGDKLIANGEKRQGILVLQQVWPRERIVARMKEVIAEMKEKVPSNPGQAAFAASERQSIQQAEKELAEFEKIENFDSALNLRVARGFFELNRFREAALIYRDMIGTLPESTLLEQANYQLLLALSRTESWPEAIDAADAYLERYPSSDQSADVAYLKAEALLRLKRPVPASEAFLRVVEEFPESTYAERAHFMAAYSLLLADQNPAAAALLEEHPEKFPKSAHLDDSAYWLAMSNLYNADYEDAREAHAAYLEAYPKGAHTVDSEFRMAQALFNQKQFEAAAVELNQFLKAHPSSGLDNDALALLGDARLALGDWESALEVYSKVTPTSDRLYDYAWFRTGKIYEALEEWETFTGHFRKFIEERPTSPRISEALKELAGYYRTHDQQEEARKLYWEAVEKFGDDPEAGAVEDMLRSLSRLYPGEEQDVFVTRLDKLTANASTRKKATLASRTRWVQAQMLQTSNPAKAKTLLLDTADEAKPTDLSVLVLADVADALRDDNQLEKATEYYRAILRYHPLSLMKDRAYAGLGFVALADGDDKKALEYFESFQKVAANSPLHPRILLATADIYEERGEREKALEALEVLINLPSTKGPQKVATIYRIGKLYRAAGKQKKAIAYFQRIYILHGGLPEYVARSYWESGQAFEELDMEAEARRTYQEFSDNSDLAVTPEYALARKRLEELPAPVAEKKEPPGA
jgi:TolA-binding protein